MPEEHEFDERNPLLLVMLGLVSLADEALTVATGAPADEPWEPRAATRGDRDMPLLR